MYAWKALLCWLGLLSAESSDAYILSTYELYRTQESLSAQFNTELKKKRHGLISDRVSRATVRKV